MVKAHFSLNFALEADEATLAQIGSRLDEELTGQIKDLVASRLSGLEFDLQARYQRFASEPEPQAVKKRAPAPVPIWSDDHQAVVAVQIGSAEWFGVIAQAGRFDYHYQELRFTVRYETRQSKGKAYSYWRAYATVQGKLRTKQLGSTARLSQAALEAVGAYFLSQTT
jgi:hypothetical protein